MVWYKRQWWQWLGAGLCLGFGFIHPMTWPAGLVGLAVVLHLSLNHTSVRQLLWGNLIAWTAKAFVAVGWFATVYPLDWFEVGLGWWQIPAVVFWWGTVALWLGCGGVVFAFIVRVLREYSSQAVFLLALPFAWLTAEIAGSYSFAIMTWGPGGAITPAFSVGYVGYLVVGHSWLIELARVLGVYGLSVFAVAAILGLLLTLQHFKRGKVVVVIVMMLLLVTSLVPGAQLNPSQDSYDVAIIDTNFDSSALRSFDGRADMRAQLDEAVQAALVAGADYVVLPEDARYFSQVNDPELVRVQFAFRTGGSEVVVVDSGRADENETAVVQSFIYNGQEAVVDQSHKRYLVPQGEFMPMFYTSVLKLFGHNETIDQFSQSVSFALGSKLGQSHYAPTSPGVLFCFESISPWGVRSIMAERGSVPFIAHPISHAWFHQPDSLWFQTKQMLRVQAVWNQQYIVSAGNKAPGALYTPGGLVIDGTEVATGTNWALSLVQVPR